MAANPLMRALPIRRTSVYADFKAGRLRIMEARDLLLEFGYSVAVVNAALLEAMLVPAVQEEHENVR